MEVAISRDDLVKRSTLAASGSDTVVLAEGLGVPVPWDLEADTDVRHGGGGGLRASEPQQHELLSTNRGVEGVVSVADITESGPLGGGSDVHPTLSERVPEEGRDLVEVRLGDAKAAVVDGVVGEATGVDLVGGASADVEHDHVEGEQGVARGEGGPGRVDRGLGGDAGADGVSNVEGHAERGSLGQDAQTLGLGLASWVSIDTDAGQATAGQVTGLGCAAVNHRRGGQRPNQAAISADLEDVRDLGGRVGRRDGD